MKVYEGFGNSVGSCTVLVDGKPLNPRYDLRNHSPDGFQWGYGGSGPAQLALALLADCVGDEEALELYPIFKWRVIAGLPKGKNWRIAEDRLKNIIGKIKEEEQCQTPRGG